jgi:hypothetical protein
LIIWFYSDIKELGEVSTTPQLLPF